MPWKVTCPASDSTGRHTKTVLEIAFDEDDDDVIDRDYDSMIMYWVRNMEPGEKVVIERFHPTDSG